MGSILIFLGSTFALKKGNSIYIIANESDDAIMSKIGGNVEYNNDKNNISSGYNNHT